MGAQQAIPNHTTSSVQKHSRKTHETLAMRSREAKCRTPRRSLRAVLLPTGGRPTFLGRWSRLPIHEAPAESRPPLEPIALRRSARTRYLAVGFSAHLWQPLRAQPRRTAQNASARSLLY